VDDLAGRVAVVTGGASGIGLAMVQRFAREGMTAIAADVRLDAAQDAVADVDGAYAEQVDVPKYESETALA
jgi:NAD(P)-dependent dehydrogenase (short-subunit alcohol dehydrogenase family)